LKVTVPVGRGPPPLAVKVAVSVVLAPTAMEADPVVSVLEPGAVCVTVCVIPADVVLE
jgi:hypothetical protein